MTGKITYLSGNVLRLEGWLYESVTVLQHERFCISSIGLVLREVLDLRGIC